jgi:hypothetical protein
MGRAGATGDPATSVSDWYALGGGQVITAVQTDLSAIGDDGAASDSVAMSADCDSLSADVGAATNYPAIPDAEAQSHWAAALTHLSTAAADCSTGAATMDADLLSASSAEITAANDELGQATARLNQLAG